MEKPRPGDPQRPTTIDGLEPEAWKRYPAVFQRRAMDGIRALYEQFEHAKEAKAILAEKIRQDSGSGAGDRAYSKEEELRLVGYTDGLQHALATIIEHLEGKPSEGKPESGLNQSSGGKK